MTNARPNALSLAVAVAISSSIIATQTLADRRLLTKSVDISGNEQVEFTQSEVVVGPTLDDNQQPIPKSFTTTYPDQTQSRAGYDVPSEGFTDVLSDIEGGVSSVDQFETGENDVAQKYTKVLKVGNEGVFRFTHNLAEKELIIEVRDGMTSRNSITAVRAQLGDKELLEPLTKIAGPEQLAGVLKVANGRAGSLGAADKYTVLATVKVDKVEVSLRTFMRLVVSGDQPPELRSLGRSLYVNDEALLAAATSAYTQVYVLGKILQEEALNELLAYQKPVGYVVHVEDETEAYYVPDGHPRLDVTQTPGEIIVFHGQKQNPTDIAFVKGLFNLREETIGDEPAPAVTVKVKKDRLKSYQYIIRSRQMTILEEFATDLAVKFDAEFEEDKLLMLARYETLQQALANANPDNANEFEFTAAHIKLASSFMTPVWIQVQLEKHFNFRPLLRALLSDEQFAQNVQKVIPAVTEWPADAVGDDVDFATRVFADMTRQLLEMEDKLEGLNLKADKLTQFKNFLQYLTEIATISVAEKHRAQELKRQIDGMLERLLQNWKDLKKWVDKLRQEADQIPELEQQVRDARAKATKFRNSQLAAELGIDDWDDTQPSEEQERLIIERIDEIIRAVASTAAVTEKSEEKAVKAKLAAIEDLLGLDPDNQDDLEARHQAIIQRLEQRVAQAGHQVFQHQQLKNRFWLKDLQEEVSRIPALQKEFRDSIVTEREDYNTQLAKELGIENWDNTEPPEEQARLIRQKINEISRPVGTTDAPAAQPQGEAVKAKLAAIESELEINPVSENDLDARYHFIQEHLQEKLELTDKAIHNRLVTIENQLGLISNNENDPQVRCQTIQQQLQLKLNPDQVDQELLQSTGTSAEELNAVKARYLTIAAQLNIANFDGNADIFEQQNRLLEKLQTINAHQKHLLKKLEAINVQDRMKEASLKIKENALASILGIEMNEERTLEDRSALIDAAYSKVCEFADLQEKLKDISNPGHPRAKPEVLLKLGAVEKALEMQDINEEDDVYHRRQAIADDMQTYVKEAAQRAEEDALEILENLEEILDIKVNEDDDKAARLCNVRSKLDGDDVSEDILNQIHHALGEEQRTLFDEKAVKFERIRAHLANSVESSEERARDQQANSLAAIEEKLNIKPGENIFAKERGEALFFMLANDLGVVLEKDASLSDQRNVLKAKIYALLDEVNEVYDDEGVRRGINNAMARQLKVEDYKDDASIDQQNRLIEQKLYQLDVEVKKTGEPDVGERIAAIDDELDRLMAGLGPKPRYVLDRELATVRRAINEAESELTDAHRRLATLTPHRKPWFFETRDGVQPVSDEDGSVLNQVTKGIQTELVLPADDEKNLEERIDELTRALQMIDAKLQDQAIDKPEAAAKDPNIQIKGDSGSLKASAYPIKVSTSSHKPVEINTVDEALGELPLTRKRYSLIKQFLRDYERKIIDLTYEMIGVNSAQENPDPEKQKTTDFGSIDEKAETRNKNEIEQLIPTPRKKSEVFSRAKKILSENKEALEVTEKALGLKPGASDTEFQRLDALLKKQIELGGTDGTGGKIRQLIQEQARLEARIEAGRVNIERMKEALKTAENAVQNEGGPSQFTPKQEKARKAMLVFMQQHSLKKQALEAAMSLAESAERNGKLIPYLATFNFDGEFAPIRLQAMVGDDLTFDQAGRIVEIFRSLKTQFPATPLEDQPLSALEEVQRLMDNARMELRNGAQLYDDEVIGMGSAAIHYVEPGVQKSFPKYFASQSDSGEKIITLLREGLISKVELENFMKAVRGVDGYQPEVEFGHFLGCRHGADMLHFCKAVRKLSDKGTEEFMQSAFIPVTVTATGPAGMKESVAGMKEYAAAVIANYVLDDIAFENGRRTAAFLANIQDTLTPYAHAAGISESELIKVIHDTLMQAHAAAVERQLKDYWVKPSAFLVQAVTWYYSSYKPLLAIFNAWQAAVLSLRNMSFLYLLDLTNRADYTHRMLTPFQHWMERYSIDLDRTGQYYRHVEIEKLSEVGGLAMPLGKAASSVILLRTGSMLFARQRHANPRMYRSISRLVPEIVKSMGSGQGVQVPLLHRVTPQKVKTLASATAGVVLGPVATVGAYAHGLLSGFTFAQTFGFALASGLTFDFFMNDNKMLTHWLGGPLGRSIDRINRWQGVGETDDEYLQRTAIASPQGFSETDEEYASRVKANNTMYGWTRHENYLQFRERRDRTMKLFENGWEKYFRENVPKWSFSHAESVPYFYTVGAFYESQKSDDQKFHSHDKRNAPQSSFLPAISADSLD
ncbi:hypothetical protein [Endozoicomonas sp. 8E]|uniref:hypothetical protein n=1 Tax=Endozoicomonas sp. 8E TaxID=3035692 RepID=UPI0029392F94|nr:hypothetical protein [Endozoicomonas sp. 8E]WOG29586.1 hypothetical protein P6910_08020 [Endozoicomonas sp. 8E]